MSQLPQPSPEAIAHSAALQQLITEQIAHSGPIPFSEYMHMALYQPGFGYYAAGLHKFGAKGDFVTAPELSPLFSQVLAGYFLEQHAGESILEFGAGSGKMAGAILTYLQDKNALPKQYFIMEVSADLAQRQQQYLQQLLPDYFASIVWLTELPRDFIGLVLANEVLDAMPVEVFQFGEQGLQQGYIEEKQGALAWQFGEAQPDLKQAFAGLNIDLAEGYQSEINLLLQPWLAALKESCKQAEILLIDYGYLKESYYHPNRRAGTLMCHYQHHAYGDPLWYPGLQDITAHVDFSAVIAAAEQLGMEVNFFCTQAEFLLGNDLLDLLPEPEDQAAYFSAAQQVKKLTMPDQMGEVFKVLSLSY